MEDEIAVVEDDDVWIGRARSLFIFFSQEICHTEKAKYRSFLNSDLRYQSNLLAGDVSK
jgi:hypothetical protein